MAKNVVVSEGTIRDLLEAHASLSAWYFALSAALEKTGASARPPGPDARAAFGARLASEFPELSAVARSLGTPRLFVPERLGGGDADADQATVIEPAAMRARAAKAGPPSSEPPHAIDDAPTEAEPGRGPGSKQ